MKLVKDIDEVAEMLKDKNKKSELKMNAISDNKQNSTDLKSDAISFE
jgi:hypothetical protein